MLTISTKHQVMLQDIIQAAGNYKPDCRRYGWIQIDQFDKEGQDSNMDDSRDNATDGIAKKSTRDTSRILL